MLCVDEGTDEASARTAAIVVVYPRKDGSL